MLLGSVVAIQVDGCPAEHLHFRWNAIVEVFVQASDDFRVRLGRGCQVDVSNAVPQEAQGITPHPLLIFRSHIYSVAILSEGPFAKDRKYFLASDLALCLFCFFQDAACLTLCKKPMSSHDETFASTAALQILDRELVSLRQLPQVPPPNRFVDIGGLVFVRDLGTVQRLVTDGTMHLDETTLVVPAPICWPAAKFESLANSLCLAVLLVPDVALRSRSLGMRPVGDLGLGHPSGCDFVGLITVASVTTLVRIGHVRWSWPLLVHALLLLFPLFHGHHSCCFGFLPAFGRPWLSGLGRVHSVCSSKHHRHVF
mmetsp:Transcript_26128/g.56657  ORF Transcript_26128/g.56657 Transcript_26128/m.56657 type:complete len:312 (+) Transcript_26128:1182-2117(+)